MRRYPWYKPLPVHCTPDFFIVQACLQMFRSTNPRGFSFRYHLINRIAEVAVPFSKQKNPKGPSIPGLRFPKYHEPYVPEWDDYKREVTLLTYHCLSMWKHVVPPSNKKKRKELYCQFAEKVSGSIYLCGPLVANPLVIPLGLMGLIPIWLCSKFAIDPNSKGFKFLQMDYGLPKGKDGVDRLV